MTASIRLRPISISVILLWQLALPPPGLGQAGGPEAVHDPTSRLQSSETLIRASSSSDGTWSGAATIARQAHSMVYDPVRDRIVVIGGFDGSLHGEVWAMSMSGPKSWVLITPQGSSPSPRYDFSAIYDPLRDRIVIFGGWTGSDNAKDVWSLSLSEEPTWSLLAPTGTSPTARRGHSAIYDPLRDRMVEIGRAHV